MEGGSIRLSWCPVGMFIVSVCLSGVNNDSLQEEPLHPSASLLKRGRQRRTVVPPQM